MSYLKNIETFDNIKFYKKVTYALGKIFQRPHKYNQEKRSIKIGFEY